MNSIIVGFCVLAVLSPLSAIQSFAAATAGHVEGWGRNDAGQATPPLGLSGVVALAAGNYTSLALLTNGTIVGWGDNSDQKIDIARGLSNVVAISVATHCVALKNDGTVVVWGSDQPGITNPPPGLNDVSAIAAGNMSGSPYTLAVRSNGTVVAWGFDQLATNVPAGLDGVVSVAAGFLYAVALKSNGTVVGWGDDTYGQATPPPGLSGVVAVRAGGSSSAAIKSDGTLVEWGALPDPPPNLGPVIDVQMGVTHMIALRPDGVVVTWGYGNYGQETVPEGLTGITAICAGEQHNLVVTRRPVILAISPPVVANAGDTVTFSVNASGDSLNYQWRRNGADLPGARNSSLTLTNVQAPDAADVYTVLVSNPYGSVLSPSTSLSFPPPSITSNPQSAARYRGESVTFSVLASGVAPLTYQWFKTNASLPGATGTTLTLTDLRFTNGGSYRVIVADGAGSRTTSAVATLTMVDPTLLVSRTLFPSVDTSIYTSGINPRGTGTILAGTRYSGIIDRGLLRFDLSSLPPNAVVRTASVRLTVVKVPQSPAPNSNFSLYRMFRSWGVDATWTNATAGVPWSAPGCLSGTDYSASNSATRFVVSHGAYDFGPSSQLAADIQAWLANPGTNQGWLLKSESEGLFRSARHFGSSESAQPPELQLQYGTPAPPARLASIVVQGGNFSFSFNAADGWFYRVERRDNLESGAWTTVTNLPAGPVRTIVVSVPMTPPHRFYRVIAE